MEQLLMPAFLLVLSLFFCINEFIGDHPNKTMSAIFLFFVILFSTAIASLFKEHRNDSNKAGLRNQSTQKATHGDSKRRQNDHSSDFNR